MVIERRLIFRVLCREGLWRKGVGFGVADYEAIAPTEQQDQ